MLGTYCIINLCMDGRSKRRSLLVNTKRDSHSASSEINLNLILAIIHYTSTYSLIPILHNELVCATSKVVLKIKNHQNISQTPSPVVVYTLDLRVLIYLMYVYMNMNMYL